MIIKNSTFYLILLFTISITNIFADNNCKNFEDSPLVQEINKTFIKAKNENISPIGFKVYDFPIVLTDQRNYPNCGTMLLEGRIKKTIQLNTNISFSNGTYLFVNKDKHKPYFDAFKKYTTNQNILFYNLANTYEERFVEKSNSQYSNDLPEHIGFIVHEAFHLFYQKTRTLNKPILRNHSHFDWLNEDHRYNLLLPICYSQKSKDPNLLEIIRNENRSLRYSYLKTIKPDINFEETEYENGWSDDYNSLSANDYLYNYVTLRKSRYKMLSGNQQSPFGPVIKSEGWEREVTCAEFEAEANYIEGTALFIEISYLHDLKLISPYEFAIDNHELFSNRNSYSLNYLSKASGYLRYFYIGMMELFLLKEIAPLRFQKYINHKYLNPYSRWDELSFNELESISKSLE
ncbi:hypothetical protein N9N67_06010 [Bacteriovoracaceae bacterium]|nr:hypothetical protein [Bacteriovoracaceae bacterium]